MAMTKHSTAAAAQASAVSTRVCLGGPEEVVAPAGLPPGSAAQSPDAGDSAELTRILGAVREAFGVDFTGYKSGTLNRRIDHRMALRRIDSRAEYADLIADDARELDDLYHSMLLVVTEFFRDPDAFARIREHVLPSILMGRDPGREVRVWAPGCASGEESYSLAMILVDAIEESGGCFPVKIIATDVNERELARARLGVYPDSRVASIPEEYRSRFVTSSEGCGRIDDAIRAMCVFSRHDVTCDPPFSHVDLVVCRNLLIYLGRELQGRVLTVFHHALRAGGFLALGLSETPSAAPGLFAAVDKRMKIFARA
jgi:two-component system CheB/CheR fusion protein